MWTGLYGESGVNTTYKPTYTASCARARASIHRSARRGGGWPRSIALWVAECASVRCCAPAVGRRPIEEVAPLGQSRTRGVQCVAAFPSVVPRVPRATQLALRRDLPPADVVFRDPVRLRRERPVQPPVGGRKHRDPPAKEARKDRHGLPVEGVSGHLGAQVVRRERRARRRRCLRRALSQIFI
jgi:hypothetical protein